MLSVDKAVVDKAGLVRDGKAIGISEAGASEVDVRGVVL